MRCDEKTIYQIEVAPSISEQLLRNELDGTDTELKFKRIQRFIQIRFHEVDGNQLILILNDITDSIVLKNSEEKQSQEKARINQTSTSLDIPMKMLKEDIDEMISL